jgi:hypothetical protein
MRLTTLVQLPIFSLFMIREFVMAESKLAPADDGKQPPVDMAKEMEAISGSLKLLGKLSLEGQHRAFSYIGNVLGLSSTGGYRPADRDGGIGSPAGDIRRDHGADNITYGSLAELDNAARPETAWQKVLVGGYWFQVCERLEEFGAQVVNDHLKEIGAKIANITVAFNTLKAANPSLVIQVRKSGKAQQARKQYKLTAAGIRAVEELIRREG